MLAPICLELLWWAVSLAVFSSCSRIDVQGKLQIEPCRAAGVGVVTMEHPS